MAKRRNTLDIGINLDARDAQRKVESLQRELRELQKMESGQRGKSRKTGAKEDAQALAKTTKAIKEVNRALNQMGQNTRSVDALADHINGLRIAANRAGQDMRNTARGYEATQRAMNSADAAARNYIDSLQALDRQRKAQIEMNKIHFQALMEHGRREKRLAAERERWEANAASREAKRYKEAMRRYRARVEALRKLAAEEKKGVRGVPAYDQGQLGLDLGIPSSRIPTREQFRQRYQPRGGAGDATMGVHNMTVQGMKKFEAAYQAHIRKLKRLYAEEQQLMDRRAQQINANRARSHSKEFNEAHAEALKMNETIKKQTRHLRELLEQRRQMNLFPAGAGGRGPQYQPTRETRAARTFEERGGTTGDMQSPLHLKGIERLASNLAAAFSAIGSSASEAFGTVNRRGSAAQRSINSVTKATKKFGVGMRVAQFNVVQFFDAFRAFDPSRLMSNLVGLPNRISFAFWKLNNMFWLVRRGADAVKSVMAGLTAGFNDQIQTAEEYQRMRIPIEQLKKLRVVAKMTDASMSEVQVIVKNINRSLDRASKEGVTRYSQALQMINVDMGRVREGGVNAFEVFEKLGKFMRTKAGDSPLVTEIMSVLGGKGGFRGAPIFQFMGRSDFKMIAAQTELLGMELGKTTEEWKEAVHTAHELKIAYVFVSGIFDGMINQLNLAMGPSVLSAMNLIKSLALSITVLGKTVAGKDGFFQQLGGEWADKFLLTVQKVADRFNRLQTELAIDGNMRSALLSFVEDAAMAFGQIGTEVGLTLAKFGVPAGIAFAKGMIQGIRQEITSGENNFGAQVAVGMAGGYATSAIAQGAVPMAQMGMESQLAVRLLENTKSLDIVSRSLERMDDKSRVRELLKEGKAAGMDRAARVRTAEVMLRQDYEDTIPRGPQYFGPEDDNLEIRAERKSARDRLRARTGLLEGRGGGITQRLQAWFGRTLTGIFDQVVSGNALRSFTSGTIRVLGSKFMSTLMGGVIVPLMVEGLAFVGRNMVGEGSGGEMAAKVFHKSREIGEFIVGAFIDGILGIPDLIMEAVKGFTIVVAGIATIIGGLIASIFTEVADRLTVSEEEQLEKDQLDEQLRRRGVMPPTPSRAIVNRVGAEGIGSFTNRPPPLPTELPYTDAQRAEQRLLNIASADFMEDLDSAKRLGLSQTEDAEAANKKFADAVEKGVQEGVRKGFDVTDATNLPRAIEANLQTNKALASLALIFSKERVDKALGSEDSARLMEGITKAGEEIAGLDALQVGLGALDLNEKFDEIFSPLLVTSPTKEAIEEFRKGLLELTNDFNANHEQQKNLIETTRTFTQALDDAKASQALTNSGEFRMAMIRAMYGGPTSNQLWTTTGGNQMAKLAAMPGSTILDPDQGTEAGTMVLRNARMRENLAIIVKMQDQYAKVKEKISLSNDEIQEGINQGYTVAEINKRAIEAETTRVTLAELRVDLAKAIANEEARVKRLSDAAGGMSIDSPVLANLVRLQDMVSSGELTPQGITQSEMDNARRGRRTAAMEETEFYRQELTDYYAWYNGAVSDQQLAVLNAARSEKDLVIKAEKEKYAALKFEYEKFTDDMISMGGDVQNTISKTIDAVFEGDFGAIGEAPQNFMKDFGKTWFNAIIKDKLQFLDKPMKANFFELGKDFEGAIAGGGSSAAKTITKEFDKSGVANITDPKKVAKTAGTLSGAYEGLSSSVSTLADSLTGFASSLVDGLGSVFDSLGSAIGGFFGFGGGGGAPPSANLSGGTTGGVTGSSYNPGAFAKIFSSSGPRYGPNFASESRTAVNLPQDAVYDPSYEGGGLSGRDYGGIATLGSNLLISGASILGGNMMQSDDPTHQMGGQILTYGAMGAGVAGAAGGAVAASGTSVLGMTGPLAAAGAVAAVAVAVVVLVAAIVMAFMQMAKTAENATKTARKLVQKRMDASEALEQIALRNSAMDDERFQPQGGRYFGRGGQSGKVMLSRYVDSKGGEMVPMTGAEGRLQEGQTYRVEEGHVDAAGREFAPGAEVGMFGSGEAAGGGGGRGILNRTIVITDADGNEVGRIFQSNQQNEGYRDYIRNISAGRDGAEGIEFFMPAMSADEQAAANLAGETISIPITTDRARGGGGGNDTTMQVGHRVIYPGVNYGILGAGEGASSSAAAAGGAGNIFGLREIMDLGITGPGSVAALNKGRGGDASRIVASNYFRSGGMGMGGTIERELIEQNKQDLRDIAVEQGMSYIDILRELPAVLNAAVEEFDKLGDAANMSAQELERAGAMSLIDASVAFADGIYTAGAIIEEALEDGIQGTALVLRAIENDKGENFFDTLTPEQQNRAMRDEEYAIKVAEAAYQKGFNVVDENRVARLIPAANASLGISTSALDAAAETSAGTFADAWGQAAEEIATGLSDAFKSLMNEQFLEGIMSMVFLPVTEELEVLREEGVDWTNSQEAAEASQRVTDKTLESIDSLKELKPVIIANAKAQREYDKITREALGLPSREAEPFMKALGAMKDSTLSLAEIWRDLRHSIGETLMSIVDDAAGEVLGQRLEEALTPLTGIMEEMFNNDNKEAGFLNFMAQLPMTMEEVGKNLDMLIVGYRAWAQARKALEADLIEAGLLPDPEVAAWLGYLDEFKTELNNSLQSGITGAFSNMVNNPELSKADAFAELGRALEREVYSSMLDAIVKSAIAASAMSKIFEQIGGVIAFGIANGFTEELYGALDNLMDAAGAELDFILQVVGPVLDRFAERAYKVEESAVESVDQLNKTSCALEYRAAEQAAGVAITNQLGRQGNVFGGVAMPNAPMIFNQPRQFAQGGVVTGAMMGIVGEAGPEAIIPLSRINEVTDTIGGMGGSEVAQELAEIKEALGALAEAIGEQPIQTSVEIDGKALVQQISKKAKALSKGNTFILPSNTVK